MALDLRHPRALTHAGAALDRLGLLDEARRTLELSVSLNPARRLGRPDARDLAFLAMTCERSGRRTEARRYAEALRRILATPEFASDDPAILETLRVVESGARPGG